MHFHWSSENTDRKGRSKGWAYKGRAWWHFARVCLGLEWNLWSNSAHASISVDPGDRKVMLTVAFPPVAIYLWLDNIFREAAFWKRLKYDEREIEISFFNGSLHWRLWGKTMEWSCTTPRWQDGHFNVVDFLLGDQQYSERDFETIETVIPMPEGNYPAKIRLFESTWSRKRSPFKTRRDRAEIKPEIPIPHPGKGENSWDCGDDATWGLTCAAKTVEGAIAAMVECVLRNRRRYGSLDHQWPKPTMPTPSTETPTPAAQIERGSA